MFTVVTKWPPFVYIEIAVFTSANFCVYLFSDGEWEVYEEHVVTDEHSYAGMVVEEVKTVLIDDVNTVEINTEDAGGVSAPVPGPSMGDAAASTGAVPASIGAEAASIEVQNMDFDDDADDDFQLDQLKAKNAAFVNSKKSKNTMKKIKLCVNRFTDWLDKRGENRSIENIDIHMLDNLLALFLTDIRKKSGDEYEPVTLQSFSNSIRKHIAEVKSGIEEDADFPTAKSVLKAKKKDLKEKGLGNQPNKAKDLSETDEEMLWECGALGDQDPETLVHTLWYLATKLLGFRGQHEARQLQWGDMEVKVDHGVEFVEWNKRLSKTRDGIKGPIRKFPPKMFANVDNPYRCPV